jgi:hypothetical protein
MPVCAVPTPWSLQGATSHTVVQLMPRLVQAWL